MVKLLRNYFSLYFIKCKGMLQIKSVNINTMCVFYIMQRMISIFCISLNPFSSFCHEIFMKRLSVCLPFCYKHYEMSVSINIIWHNKINTLLHLGKNQHLPLLRRIPAINSPPCGNHNIKVHHQIHKSI